MPSAVVVGGSADYSETLNGAVNFQRVDNETPEFNNYSTKERAMLDFDKELTTEVCKTQSSVKKSINGKAPLGRKKLGRNRPM